jgi:KaiC/GvpD/RAD55 family RecA-like ATPase
MDKKSYPEQTRGKTFTEAIAGMDADFDSSNKPGNYLAKVHNSEAPHIEPRIEDKEKQAKVVEEAKPVEAKEAPKEAPEEKIMKKDPESEGRVTTGSDNLDKLLGGGLPPGSIMLMIGEPGTGKTSLLRKFLSEGVKKGDDSLYLLTNRLLDRVILNMKRMGYDLRQNPHVKFILYDGTTKERVPSFVGNFEDLIDVAYNSERIISSFSSENKRMVIDDLSYLFLMHNKELIFKFIHRMSQLWRKNNITCLIEVQKGMLDPQIITALESMTSGTIEMKREGNTKSMRITRLDEEMISQEWVVLDMPKGTHVGSEEERHLDEWQKVISESEDGEEKVKSFLKGIRKDLKKPPKGRSSIK